jgi:hypothetical protein
LRWFLFVYFGNQPNPILSNTVRYSKLKIIFFSLAFTRSRLAFLRFHRKCSQRHFLQNLIFLNDFCNSIPFMRTTVLWWWQLHIVVFLSLTLYHLSVLFACLLLLRENSPFHAIFMIWIN